MIVATKLSDPLERWGEALAAVIPDRCREHDLTITEDFWWMVNDYVCDPVRDPDHVDFLFCGFHVDEDIVPACIPVQAYGVPGGLIVEFNGPDWRRGA